MADAAEIARRYRETDVSLATLVREYRCAYPTILRAMLSQMSLAEYRRLAHKRLGPGGVKTRFRKGLIPWNKGRKGWCPAGCEATQFQPGCIRGQAACRYKPVGTIMIRRDHGPRSTQGRINRRPGPPRRYLKITDEGPAARRWMIYARYVYERQHGPIPKGMVVLHKDGKTLNDAPENLVLADRAGNCRYLEVTRPKAMARRRRRSAAAARRRHAQNRAAKRWAKQQRRQARKVWECESCGADFKHPVPRCPKCGAATIAARKVTPRPESMVLEAIMNEIVEGI